MVKKIISLLCIASFVIGAVSCKKEEQHQEIVREDNRTAKVIQQLNGTVILGQDVKMAGVDKSRLQGGVPTKFRFHWKEAEKKMEIQIVKIQPGSMPFAIGVTANATLMELSSWEKNEYPEAGWIKLFDDKGEVTPYLKDDDPAKPKPDGAMIMIGFYNVNTQEIEFSINYNMMNVVGHVFRQKIDAARLKNFDEEYDAYEEALAEWKLDHGDEQLRGKTYQYTVEFLGESKTLPAATLSYEGKTTQVDLPIHFQWEGGTEYTNVTKRMRITLPKTLVGANNIQISFDASARFAYPTTKTEQELYQKAGIEGEIFSHYVFTKLKAVNVATTIWNAEGTQQLKTSNKGELRIITRLKKDAPSIRLAYVNKELGLSITSPIIPLEGGYDSFY